jgi:hypothetical protein
VIPDSLRGDAVMIDVTSEDLTCDVLHLTCDEVTRHRIKNIEYMNDVTGWRRRHVSRISLRGSARSRRRSRGGVKWMLLGVNIDIARPPDACH